MGENKVLKKTNDIIIDQIVSKIKNVSTRENMNAQTRFETYIVTPPAEAAEHDAKYEFNMHVSELIYVFHMYSP